MSILHLPVAPEARPLASRVPGEPPPDVWELAARIDPDTVPVEWRPLVWVLQRTTSDMFAPMLDGETLEDAWDRRAESHDLLDDLLAEYAAGAAGAGEVR